MLRGLLAASAIGVFGYLGYAGRTWLRYGKHASLPRNLDQPASPLDPFLPEYEVGELHEIRVNAPADAALDAINFGVWKRLWLVDLLFKARELIVGKGDIERPDISNLPEDLIDGMKTIGWTLLSHVPGREVIFGAAAQPWNPNGTFLKVVPEGFKSFRDPRQVKIGFGFQAVPLSSETCLLRTLTRVQCTDAEARRRFRVYWAFFSPGIYLIRRILLLAARNEAEERWRLRLKAA